MFSAPQSLASVARAHRPGAVRTVLSLVVLSGLVWALASCSTANPTVELSPASRADTSKPATSIRRISPLTATGHLRKEYDVAATGKGYCWSPSFENGHLYRCMRGNYISDPCWKEAGRRSVVCLAVPWAKHVTRIRLTRKLPAASNHGPSLWGLRIGDGIGAGCSGLQGASTQVGRKWVSYVCQRGWALLASPNRSQESWTMSTARMVKGHYQSRGTHHLSVAWRAVLR